MKNLYNMQNTSPNITRQQKVQKSPIKWAISDLGLNYHRPTTDFFPTCPVVDDVIKYCPRIYVEKMTPAERSLLNTVIWAYIKFKGLWMSQTTLGKWAGMERSYVNVTIKKFTKWGIISKLSRYSKTCKYSLSNFFKDRNLVEILGDLLPALKLLPFALSTLLINNSIFTLKQIRNIDKSEHHSTTRVAMNDQDQVDIIQGLTYLRLTPWGKIQLLAFHQHALLYADKHLRQARNVQDPFKYFCKLATLYSKDNNIDLDFQRVATLQEKYAIPLEMGSTHSGSFVTGTPPQTPEKTADEETNLNHKGPALREQESSELFDEESQPRYVKHTVTPPPTPAPRAAAPRKDKPLSTTEMLAKQTKSEGIRTLDEEQERLKWAKIKADMIAKHGEQGPAWNSFEHFTWKLALKNTSDL